METEKVCVNLSGAELGTVDVLVARGVYTSRSDAIRAGLRRLMDEHESVVEQATKKATTIGVMLVGKSELERLQREKRRVRLFVVGILRIAPGVTPALAAATIEEIRIIGSLRAPDAVVERLDDRITRGLPGVEIA